MAIILQMIVIRYTQEISVIASPESPQGQRVHTGFVIDFKCVRPRLADVAFLPEALMIDVHYCFSDLFIQGFHAGIDVSLKFFNQMGLQKADMVFNRGFPFLISNC